MSSMSVITANSNAQPESSPICSQCQKIDFAALWEEGWNYTTRRFRSRKTRAQTLEIKGFPDDFNPLEVQGIDEDGTTRYKVKDCAVCEFFYRYTVKAAGKPKPFPAIVTPYFKDTWQYFESSGSPLRRSNGNIVRERYEQIYRNSSAMKKIVREPWLSYNHRHVTTLELHISARSEFSEGFIPFSISTTSSHVSRHQRSSNRAAPWHRRVDAKEVDFDLLRRWLDVCESQHPCAARPLAASNYALRLIDCGVSPVHIVEGKNDDEYLALSYVWGVPDLCPLENAPQVVLDAVSVVLKLGKRYLWVDKYCVDQEDEVLKMEQVRNMGAIYENAFATIVAAVGDNEGYGLCGVSRERNCIPYVELSNGVRFIGAAKDQNCTMRGTWNERGWCLQEQLCSRRLLIFASEEVYFECKHMRCRESVEKVDVKLGGPFNLLCGHSRHSMHATLLEHSVDVFWDCVMSYMTRKLSKDTDALNAFCGVLQRMEVTGKRNGTEPISSFLGMPILGHLKRNKGKRHSYRDILMVESLGWEGNLLARRKQFPSWTWLGWESSDHGLAYEPLPVGSGVLYARCWTLLKDKSEVSFSKYLECKPKIDDTFKYLALEAPILPVKIVETAHEGYFGLTFPNFSVVQRSFRASWLGNYFYARDGEMQAALLYRTTRAVEEVVVILFMIWKDEENRIAERRVCDDLPYRLFEGCDLNEKTTVYLE